MKLVEMIKRLIAIFMAIALCICLCACGESEYTRSSDRLFEVAARYADCTVLRHVETNVLYVDDGYGFSVLLNADGTPMIWEGNYNQR